MAFNRSRWSAVFFAMGIYPAPSLHPGNLIYGGIFLFCALLSFFQRSDPDRDTTRLRRTPGMLKVGVGRRGRGIMAFGAQLPPRIETWVHPAAPMELAERSGKGSGGPPRPGPTCGATVAIEHRFRPNCGRASTFRPRSRNIGRRVRIRPGGGSGACREGPAVPPSGVRGVWAGRADLKPNARAGGDAHAAARPLAVDRDEGNEYEYEGSSVRTGRAPSCPIVSVRPVRET